MRRVDPSTSAETETWPFRRECPIEPPPQLAQLRDRDDGFTAVSLPTGIDCVLATKYADVRTILTHPDVSSQTWLPGFPHMSESTKANRGTQATFVRMDPPEHDAQRRMLSAYFTVRRMNDWRPFLEEFVDGLLDEVAGTDGPVDLVSTLCEPVPGVMISKMLDLPLEQREFFQERFAIYMGNHPPEVIAEVNQEILDYLAELIDARIGGEGDDMVTRLAREHVLAGELTRDEFVQMLHLLVFAGFDTTANAIALGIVTLLEHEDQLEYLLEDLSRVPAAVEELLRYLSVAHLSSVRVTKADVEVNGTVIPDETGIIALVLAANHDPERFPDPGKFDLSRDARSHIAFGAGIHACLGAALARMELRVVFERLLRRFPQLRLAAPMEDLEYHDPLSLVYGVRSLPVVLGDQS